MEMYTERKNKQRNIAVLRLYFVINFTNCITDAIALHCTDFKRTDGSVYKTQTKHTKKHRVILRLYFQI